MLHAFFHSETTDQSSTDNNRSRPAPEMVSVQEMSAFGNYPFWASAGSRKLLQLCQRPDRSGKKSGR